MQIAEFKSWTDFRANFSSYFQLNRNRREQLWFRGHSTRSHTLETTLDRGRIWSIADERLVTYQRMLNEFRLECLRLGDLTIANLRNEIPFELIARHVGLPSPYLDWTTSPLVAASFAYQNSHRHKSQYVAIYVLDRDRFPSDLDYVELIDDPELVRFNSRALKQRGVFMRIGDALSDNVEVILSDCLTKIEIQLSDEAAALAEFDEIGLNQTSLLGDLSAAAQTATMRVERTES